jgi:hypothetical protein
MRTGWILALLLCGCLPEANVPLPAKPASAVDAAMAADPADLGTTMTPTSDLAMAIADLTLAVPDLAPPPPIRIGETNILDIDDSGNADLLLAQSATLAKAGTIQSLSFYVTQAAGLLRLGIYDATGPNGGPGQKRAETAEMTPVVGFNTVKVVTPVALTAGTYWLAYAPSDNNLHFVRTDGGSIAYYSQPYGAMPAVFSTTPTNMATHWSFYATLTP